MKKSIMIDGLRYENRETVKYYWTWNKDKKPAAQLMVDGGKFVLEDENIATPCRSVADADDFMENVMMWYREDVINDLYSDLYRPFTDAEGMYAEGMEELRDRIEYAITEAESYIERLNVRGNRSKIEEAECYIEKLRKLAASPFMQRKGWPHDDEHQDL
jgi:hypothetical protein